MLRFCAMAPIQPLIDHDELAARVTSLAQEIRADFPNDPIHFVCVLKGAFLFLSDLVRSMEGQVTMVLKRTGGWLIEAYRYTIKPAPAAQTTPAPLAKRPGGPGGSH